MPSPQLLLLDRTTVFVSQENGDVEPRQPQGFFFNDVRHLSDWRVLIDGRQLTPLTSRAVDYFSGRVVAAPDGKDPPLADPQRPLGDQAEEDQGPRAPLGLEPVTRITRTNGPPPPLPGRRRALTVGSLRPT